MKLEAKSRRVAESFADARLERAEAFSKKWNSWISANSKRLKSLGVPKDEITRLSNTVKYTAKEISLAALNKKIQIYDNLVKSVIADLERRIVNS